MRDPDDRAEERKVTTAADFGAFDREVIVFGGAVSNAHALKALLEVAGGSPMISTGDAVAYCGDPAGAVDLHRRHGIPTIKGNCEESLAAGAGDCGCGFSPGSVCDLLSVAWYAHADKAMTAEDRNWMAGLPSFATFQAFGRRWGVLHGGATETARFLWPTSTEAAFAEEIAALEAVTGPLDAVLSGHCGLPFQRQVAGRLWLNSGALGMPPNDGDPRTSYAVIGPDGPRIERLAYDHAGAAATMREAGLVQGYHQTLETGWWPSEDVLPPELRRVAEPA
ncbi:MAG: metallophosphoesterase family protein [Pseudomonadota bacterium]